MTDLVFILGDQLSPSISSLKAASRDTARILMAEVMEEASYVPHHKKKIAFLFSAMRHFAESLREDGWTVDYVQLDDDGNSGSFTGELKRAIGRHGADRILVTEPGEWRVRQDMEAWAEETGLPVDILEDDRFLCSHEDFRGWAEGRKALRMEYFYREMRRKTGLLMEDGEPAGGKWNYDAENRKPAEASLFMPKLHRTETDPITEEVLALVADRFADNFGDLEPFWFAVTREEAEAARAHFVAEALPDFGDYQDAMLAGEKFLYHSLLSLYINAGLLDPLETCRMAEEAWKAGDAPLNAVEGFIRQIIGWREYVRGIYWLKMPDYAGLNFFGSDRPLPDFYWTGETDMACLRAAITQTKEDAYAHHIQRLMLTGNFALLAGIDPKAVHEWYLAVYVDAYEWVELPNTLGMSQYADACGIAFLGSYYPSRPDYCCFATGGCDHAGS
ncbi:MAG: cryptochrome/photolyase family protein, partial [Hyphomonas sp.]